jgi:GcrA cell cycle regulator
MSAYCETELREIARWLGEGLSASGIASALGTLRGSPVSRSAIIGIVHRDATLSAIGFAKKQGRPCVAKATVAKIRSARKPRVAKEKTAAAGKGMTARAPHAKPAPARAAPPRAGERVKVTVRRARQPHGVAMRFIDCLFGRCRAPLDMTFPENPEDHAPGGRPSAEMLCCGMRTRGLKSYCAYHQARFFRPAPEEEMPELRRSLPPAERWKEYQR